jgi:Flp pilus assembly protein TadB
MKNNNSGSAGLGISGVLTIVFIVLKLVKVIDWSWWWVFSPLLIELGLAAVILIIGTVVASLRKKRRSKRNSKR